MNDQVESEAEAAAAASTVTRSPSTGVLWRELRHQAKPAAATDLRTIAESGTPTPCEVLGIALIRFAASGGVQAHLWLALLSLPVTTCFIGLGTPLAWATPVLLLSSAVFSLALLTFRGMRDWRLEGRGEDWLHVLGRLRPTAEPVVAATWWRRRRPAATEVLDALGDIEAGFPIAAQARHALADMERRRAAGSLSVDEVVETIAGGPLHERLAARILFGRMGSAAGEVIDSGSGMWRRDERVRDLPRLLRQESRLLRRTLPRDAVCARCVCRPKASAKRGIAGITKITWFGCPRCGSAEWLRSPGGAIVCVLDRAGPVEAFEEGDSMRVNWLARALERDFEGEELFEFDRVEIRNASDTDVEHFLVDIMSDTDRGRRKRHARAACVVAAGCTLSRNTLTALRGTFRDVTVE